MVLIGSTAAHDAAPIRTLNQAAVAADRSSAAAEGTTVPPTPGAVKPRAYRE